VDAAGHAGKGRAGIEPGDRRAGQTDPAGEAAQVEHVAERARDSGKPVVDALEHVIAQEAFVAARRAVAALAAQVAVEDLGIAGTILGHGALVRRRAAGDKAGVAHVRSWIEPLLRIADLALPPRCPGCGEITPADHRFCARCWTSLHFLGPPWCAACHLPFDHDRGEGARCAACIADPPAHDGIRAAVAYGEVARAVALKLKYAGRLACAATMARAMARLMPAEAELLVPVPLHRWRLWSRGFNQAGLIAASLSRAHDIRFTPDLLRRVKATPVLRGLGARARARAVAGAFALAPGAPTVLAGKTVVLVDDVHTSGATATACARLLKRGGAARVILLCWARVLQEEETAD